MVESTAQDDWRQLAADPVVATCEYSFGPGSANALLVGIAGGVAIISPPRGAVDSICSAARSFGEVRALVAPNAFHHMGLAAWKERFPQAQVYAPAQSIARVSAKSGIAGIRPVSEAAALFGDRVTLTDMPHYKTGEALVRIRTGGGLAWYVTDAIFNMTRLPDHPVASFVFRAARSAPGLRLNRVAPIFMVKDRAALWRWLKAEAERDAPRWLIPAHGAVLDQSAQPDRLRALFAEVR